jgi:tyrosyl-tRNA synthetase
LAEIGRLERLQGAEINEAKKILANEATALAHGHEAAILAAETARRAFEEGEAATTLPGIDVPAEELNAGIPVFQIFVRAGLATSNGDARRLIRGGGARVNDVAITAEDTTISAADLRDGAIKLSAGRKQHRLVRPA